MQAEENIISEQSGFIFGDKAKKVALSDTDFFFPNSINKIYTFGPKIKNKVSGKKFKKLLMSAGFSRNIADLLSWIVGEYQGLISYKNIYNTVHAIIELYGKPTFFDILQIILIEGARKTNG
jgi:hypothetical protein